MMRTDLPDDLPPGSASVTIDRTGAVVVATVTGELDAASAPQVDSTLTDALRTSDQEVHLDLGGVAFCDSSGTKVMFTLDRTLGRRGARLVVCNPSPPVRRVLDIVDPATSLLVRSATDAPGSDRGPLTSID